MDLFHIIDEILAGSVGEGGGDDEYTESAVWVAQHSFHPTESTTDFGEADALDNLPEGFTRSVSHDGVLFLPDPSELQALHKYCNAVQMEVLSAITKDASAASDAAKPSSCRRN